MTAVGHGSRGVWHASLVAGSFIVFAAFASLQAECIGMDCPRPGVAAVVPVGWCTDAHPCHEITLTYEEAVRDIASRELADESDASLAVRLVLGEIGADRLLQNRYGLLEAVGVLYTLRNRGDESVWNPSGEERAPHYPGCGPDATRQACASPSEYIGLRSRRSLTPTRVYTPVVLREAVRRGALAWWLVESGRVPDLTGGATVFVHRCGGTDYGGVTPHCDGHLGFPEGDVVGAVPSTGPLVFKGPRRWDAERELYTLGVTGWVDYDPWWRRAPAMDNGESVPPVEDRLRPAEGVRGDIAWGWLVEGLGPPTQADVLRSLHANGGLRVGS